jgi:hypothetical protein
MFDHSFNDPAEMLHHSLITQPERKTTLLAAPGLPGCTFQCKHRVLATPIDMLVQFADPFFPHVKYLSDVCSDGPPVRTSMVVPWEHLPYAVGCRAALDSLSPPVSVVSLNKI